MKLWLLDANVIIDLLEMGLFNKLIQRFDVHVASTVASEVQRYRTGGVTVIIDFHSLYIKSNMVKEDSAKAGELADMLNKLPSHIPDTIDPGEIESLAIMMRDEELTFCTCDAAAVGCLPMLDLSERAISVETLLKKCGLSSKHMKGHHTEKAFQSMLRKGQEQNIYNVQFTPYKKSTSKLT